MAAGPVRENVLGFGRIPVQELFDIHRVGSGVVCPSVLVYAVVLAQATFEGFFSRLETTIVCDEATVVLDHVAVTA